MRPRLVLVPAALLLLAACSGTSSAGSVGHGAGTASPEGSATLGALCQEIHAAVDALVASDPNSQAAFVTQIQRISDASTNETRRTIAPLVSAGRALVDAGVGSGFYAARDGVHAAVVVVNDACVKLDSPILHR